MPRAVKQISPTPNYLEEGPLPRFSSFANYPNLVLLGDPGAGKTHLFKDAAAKERARYIKARSFLVTPSQQFTGQSLFIDGLDEKRAGRSDRDTVDALVTKLFEANPKQVRISCRAADWLGDSDLAALRPYFEQHGDPPVLLLTSLNRSEQLEVLAGKEIGRDRAEAFLDEAADRALGDFLGNPQNLIMLWDAVLTGSWPTTRKELFEFATGLMLAEFNDERARVGSGTYTVHELRPVAGAIYATSLISDIEAISLTEQEGTNDVPGYRTLTFIDPPKTLAALSRRIFTTGTEPETVEYTHRTTAEYLAASFLAERIRAGLPIGRAVSLIGVDGYPASELRGLHAWLAVHLPEHANLLIEADPYGILTYGDAGSLSPSSCSYLIGALAQLSKKDPWFRSENWQAQSIGSLARPDMVGEFRKVLNDPEAGSGVRSIVMDALSLGPPIPEMLPDLGEILLRECLNFVERLRALVALIRLRDIAKPTIKIAFQKLGKSKEALRLRADILQFCYNDPFNASDVTTLINDNLDAEDKQSNGALYGLQDKIPDSDLTFILDGINAPSQEEDGFDQCGWEIGNFYTHILSRAWQTDTVFGSERTLAWLHKRASFSGHRSGADAESLRLAMVNKPERIAAIAEYFFSTLEADENVWLKINRFYEIVRFGANIEDLFEITLKHLEAEQDESKKQILLYHVGFNFCYWAENSFSKIAFEKLYVLAEAKIFLQPTRNDRTKSDLPEKYFKYAIASRNKKDSTSQRQDFSEKIELIRSGTHLGWIAHIAKIYFGLYSDIDHSLTPRERIVAWLGSQNLAPALEGLRACLTRNDTATFEDALNLMKRRRHYDWWYGLVAGLNERWEDNRFFGLSDDLLKILIAFDLTNSIYISRSGSTYRMIHPWIKPLLETRPELIRDTYLAIIRIQFENKQQTAEGLYQLFSTEELKKFRKDTVLELLRDFPNTNQFQLVEMFDVVAATPTTHETFSKLAEQVISKVVVVDERQYDLWLATAYFLAPQTYEKSIAAQTKINPCFIFDLRERGNRILRDTSPEVHQLSVLEFVTRLVGTTFQNVSPPSRGEGDRNPWDASRYFQSLISAISAHPSEEAADSLRRLLSDLSLSSYNSDILHAIANQQQRRRETEFDRPNWTNTIAALSNSAPATVADLHAIIVANLHDLTGRIARTNTDIWKHFWNIDSYAKPVSPRPEESCRDYIIDLLRAPLLPLGITVEPEGHMANDKRADISIAMPGRKILCELKRDYHTELWTAIEKQLERFYTHDPEAKGFGVYCVFWFGPNRQHAISNPPNGMSQPTSAVELKRMLENLMSEQKRKRIAVIVIDVSGHA